MNALPTFRKTLPFVTGLLLINLTIISCGDDDDQGNNTNAAVIEAIEADMSTGTWIVTLYNDSGMDETSDYNGFTFSFNSDGSLVATNGSETYNGTWSVTDDDDSGDDDSSGSEEDIDFNIAFSSPEILAEFTDDWDIESRSASMIALFDVSGGDGTTDRLTFEKN